MTKRRIGVPGKEAFERNFEGYSEWVETLCYMQSVA